jgi:hypothetical protein
MRSFHAVWSYRASSWSRTSSAAAPISSASRAGRRPSCRARPRRWTRARTHRYRARRAREPPRGSGKFFAGTPLSSRRPPGIPVGPRSPSLAGPYARNLRGRGQALPRCFSRLIRLPPERASQGFLRRCRHRPAGGSNCTPGAHGSTASRSRTGPTALRERSRSGCPAAPGRLSGGSPKPRGSRRRRRGLPPRKAAEAAAARPEEREQNWHRPMDDAKRRLIEERRAVRLRKQATPGTRPNI